MPKGSPRQARATRIRSKARAPLIRGRPRGLDDFLIVGIGASAGGLDACRKLVEALPARSGMAFILVQHLDPTHESMMVDLLASHTQMIVRQAEDGMLLERSHLYGIPPGTYLSVACGALHRSKPQARHGARLPFDFLLHSLAEEYGERAVGVILSGTAADGSLGLKAVKEKGGLVIAQDPDEAAHDGMPHNAILTGAVDLVLPVAKVPDALVKYDRRMALTRTQNGSRPQDATQDWLPEIIDLLRARTAHDFRLYKPGTLQRRIERRMAMAAIETDDMDRYLKILHSDARELDLLAKDLLINVTSFFRDPKVFDLLAEKIVPDLVRRHAPDDPVRIWVAGCSAGGETSAGGGRVGGDRRGASAERGHRRLRHRGQEPARRDRGAFSRQVTPDQGPGHCRGHPVEEHACQPENPRRAISSPSKPRAVTSCRRCSWRG